VSESRTDICVCWFDQFEICRKTSFAIHDYHEKENPLTNIGSVRGFRRAIPVRESHIVMGVVGSVSELACFFEFEDLRNLQFI